MARDPARGLDQAFPYLSPAMRCGCNVETVRPRERGDAPHHLPLMTQGLGGSRAASSLQTHFVGQDACIKFPGGGEGTTPPRAPVVPLLHPCCGAAEETDEKKEKGPSWSSWGARHTPACWELWRGSKAGGGRGTPRGASPQEELRTQGASGGRWGGRTPGVTTQRGP